MDSTPILFRAVASTLAANGYRPVPIKQGEKRPPLADWQHFAYAPGDETRFGDCGAGVLLGHDLVAVDIDVEDPDAAAAIEASVREILGIGDVAGIPRRVGNPPRVLLPFRAAAPFKKMKSASFTMLSTGSAAHVEILAEGQQFVAFHVHPTTGRPYVWNGGGDLLQVPLGELFELTEAQAVAIIAAAETILEEWGERVVEKPNEKVPGATLGDEVPEGGRDDALYKFGCKLARDRCTAAEIEAALFTLNARCKPPLPENDVRRIARQAAKHIPPKEPGPPPAEPADASWPVPLDLIALSAREPELPQFIVRDWLPCGYATLFAGHGGVGKSAIGLHIAASIALGRPFFGIEVAQRRVLYLSCEDRKSVLHWRLAHIARHMGIALADLHDALDVLDLVGHDTTLWNRDPRTGNTVTPAFGQLMQRAEASGAEVLAVDGISDTYGGNENARPDVKRYVNALLSLLPPAGALLLLGHVNRPTASNPATAEGYSGSTGWHNAVRSRWYLYPETELDEDGARQQRSGRLILELQKSNLGNAQRNVSFRFDEQARMFIATGSSSSDLVDSIRNRAEQRGILRAMLASAAAGVAVPAAMQGPRTAYLVLSHRPEFPDALRGGAKVKTRRFVRHVEALRAIRHIADGSIRRSDRHRAAILDVTPEGRADVGNS